MAAFLVNITVTNIAMNKEFTDYVRETELKVSSQNLKTKHRDTRRE
jgi:hypothetical protein